MADVLNELPLKDDDAPVVVLVPTHVAASGCTQGVDSECCELLKLQRYV